MKSTLILILFSLAISSSTQSVIRWQFSTKKISDTTYEIHITAKVDQPWHIYSQNTPNGGPLPTKISFSKNPLIHLQGKAKENGTLVRKHEDVFGVDVKYFDGSVEFVQTVKLKSNAKTNVSGSIEFMACTDEQCLPPQKVKFSIKLE